jgi:hypothetical protein
MGSIELWYALQSARMPPAAPQQRRRRESAATEAAMAAAATTAAATVAMVMAVTEADEATARRKCGASGRLRRAVRHSCYYVLCQRSKRSA